MKKPGQTAQGQAIRLQKAQTLHAQGKLDAAQRLYKQLLKSHPQHPIALANLGAIYLARQQFTQAIIYLKKALTQDPNYKDALNNLLLLHLQEKNYPQAAQLGSQLTQLEPSNSQYTLRSYLAHSKQDQRQAMHQLLNGYINACQTNQTPPDTQLENYYLDSLFEFEDYQSLTTYLETQHHHQQTQNTPQLNTYLRLARLHRELHNYPEAIHWLEQIPQDQQDGFGYHTECLKTYGKANQEDQALPSGQWLLEFKDRNGHQHSDPAKVSALTADWHTKPLPEFNSDTPERNIIAFSLFGEDEKYTLAALVNAQLAKKIYPGWTARFYCGSSVPPAICQSLKDEGAQVIHMDESQGRFAGLFWRFYAANDPNIDYFVCRDCDALLNDKEYLAVQDWLDSGKPFHLMRDHIQHAEIMLAGLWGGVAGWLPNLEEQVQNYYQPGMSRWADQNFQQIHLWPLIKPYTLTHDTYYSIGDPEATRPFPKGHSLPKEWHVGGYVPLKVAKNFKANQKRQHLRTIQDYNPLTPPSPVGIALAPTYFETSQHAYDWLEKNASQLKLAQLNQLAATLPQQHPQADLLNLLGILLAKQQQNEQALSLLEQAVNLAPHISKYPFNAALVAINGQQSQAAERWITYFAQQFNEPDELHRLKTRQQAIQKTQHIHL